MKTLLIIALLATAIVATPLAAAAPHMECSYDPDVWYQACQPIADCVNGLLATPKRLCS